MQPNPTRVSPVRGAPGVGGPRLSSEVASGLAKREVVLGEGRLGLRAGGRGQGQGRRSGRGHTELG